MGLRRCGCQCQGGKGGGAENMLMVVSWVEEGSMIFGCQCKGGEGGYEDLCGHSRGDGG